MKVDLGIAAFDLPQGFHPSTVICLGPIDSRDTPSAGPTMAKTQKRQYRRTMALTASPVAADTVPEQILNQGLNDIQQRVRAKVAAVREMQIDGHSARSAELRHADPMDKSSVVTFALLTFADGFVRTILMTVLDDPAVVDEARGQFESIIASFRGGETPKASSKPKMALKKKVPTKKRPRPK